MKTIKYIALSTLLLTASSCGNDWLNIEPSTQVQTESAIQILSDIEFTLNGIYSSMQDAYSYSGRMTYYGDVTGDDVQANGSTKRTGSYYLFKFTKDNAPSTHWSTSYSIIQNCNMILTHIDNMDAKDKEAYRDDLKGQALTLRALALFDLTRIFGYPYMKDNGASLGVPIVKDLSTINSKPTRSTVADCYKEVISDLTTAIPLLSEKFVKGKINKWASMTLLSRVYLYKGANAEALATAEEAIKGAKKNKYELWTNEEYATAWGNDSEAGKQGEVLFEIVNLTVDGPGKESMGYLCSSSGYSDMALTTSFYKLLNEDPKDVRNKAYKLYKSKDGKTVNAYINKYQPQGNENIADANIPVLRLSELYLNAAEAAVKLDDNTNAVNYLDPIVKRANPAKTVVGQTITLNQVLTERRKELYGEGHRMFDALRNNQRIERKDVSGTGLTIKHLTMADEAKSFDWNYYKVVFPIPKKEMDVNTNLIQNPGY
ncbi:RagB/SusD family nutrient uptake outer membrane protein [Bacteroides sp.]